MTIRKSQSLLRPSALSNVRHRIVRIHSFSLYRIFILNSTNTFQFMQISDNDVVEGRRIIQHKNSLELPHSTEAIIK